MSHPYGPESDLPALERRIHEIEARIVSGRAGLSERVPELSGWSQAEHLFHVVLANELSLKNAVALHARHGRLIRDPEDARLETEAHLIEGVIPRGHTAPRFVTPPKAIDIELLLEFVLGNRSLIGELEVVAGELAHAPRAIPHQLIGDLDAVQWVRFARVHTDHHWAIVGEIEAVHST
ncbi:MAG: hypothetical protein WD226_08505 [Planctomycetota bacterium]